MPPPAEPSSNAIDERALGFFDHLEELRVRLFKSLIALVLGVVVGYFLAPWPLEWLARPVIHTQQVNARAHAKVVLKLEVGEDGTLRVKDRSGLAQLSEAGGLELYLPGQEAPVGTYYTAPVAPLLYLHPMDPFVIRLKAAFIVGLILSLPVLLYQAWAFIAPGLLASERRLAFPLILSGSLLFPLGATFAYFLLDATLLMLSSFSMDNTMMMNDARAYLGFALTMMLAFGGVFELPIVVVLATRTGLVTVDWLAARRRYVFVVLMIVAAVITPTGDPFTLMAMGAPLYVLFEISLIASRIVDRLAARDAAT